MNKSDVFFFSAAPAAVVQNNESLPVAMREGDKECKEAIADLSHQLGRIADKL